MANKLLGMIPHVVNASILAIVLYYCTQSASFTLFHWHPPLMTAAFGLLINYGLSYTPIGSFDTKEAIIHSDTGKTKPQRILAHVIIQVTTTIAAVVGGTAMYMNTARFANAHGASWHAFLGFIAIGWLVAQFIGGLFLYSTMGRRVIAAWGVTLRRARMMHTGMGTWLLFGGTVVLILGFYTNWFVGKVNSGIWWYSVIGTIVALFINLAQSTVQPAKTTD